MTLPPLFSPIRDRFSIWAISNGNARDATDCSGQL